MLRSIIGWTVEHKMLILLFFNVLCNYLWLAVPNNRNKLKFPNKIVILLIVIFHTIMGLVLVKFMAIIEAGFIIENSVNMRLYGLIFFAPLLCLLSNKLFNNDRKDVFDIYTLSIIVSLIIMRFNCIIGDCCRGIPIFGTNIIAPVRELEIIFHLILIFVFDNMLNNDIYKGKIYPIYMVLYGIFRFIYEFFREGEGLFHFAHLWSLISISIGIMFTFLLNEKERKKYEKI